MFEIDKKNKMISITRGDVGDIVVTSNAVGGSSYMFKIGDVVRLTVTEKKNYSEIVLQKDVTVIEEAYNTVISLTGKDTKIGDVINKPVDYWYEIELNPETKPQTLIGHDKSGPKIFRLYPEGR